VTTRPARRAALSEGGEEGPCGWLKDKFGVSRQIVPTVLTKLLADPDRERSQRVMRAMLAMKKIEISALEEAAAQT
jgi:predicted 3-demethylubiquinone-9 3-methyltransferase (glyoxalase superfamily)